MRKQRIVLGVSTTLLVSALALGGCAAQQASADDSDTTAQAETTVIETGLDPKADWQVNTPDDPAAVGEGVYEGLDERRENHPAEIKTYPDGTRVQRTPDRDLDATLQVHDHISFNTYRLNADNRGCGACHDDLAATAANIAGYPHLDFTDNEVGVQWDEAACKGCHVGHFATKYDEWSGLIHGIHDEATNKMFVQQGGDCWSCHYASTKGEDTGMTLWDDVKYKVMHGIEAIDAENLPDTFANDQDKTISSEGTFSYTYIRDRSNEEGKLRWGREYLGLTPDVEGAESYDNWNITIGGECDNPKTMTLAELIAELPESSVILQGQCVDNGPGGSLVYNVEVKGILLRDIIDYFGMKDTCNSIIATGADGSTSGYGIDRLYNSDVILGYEVGGAPLTYQAGYPVTVWTPGVALDNMKSVVDLEFSTEPGEVDEAHPHGAHNLDGENFIYPNVAICNFLDGQIIEAGQPYTFEGYVSAINSGITSIEFSMDQGKTWKKFDTPDNDWQKWNWWTFEWTPENPGWYTLSVRATADDGTVSSWPAQKLITVEAAEGAEE